MFQLVAVLGYLIPVAVVLVLRCRRDRAIWQLGLDIPFAVALDLTVVLLLARLVTLETATFLSRVGWLGALAFEYFRRSKRGQRPEWPAALSRRDLAWVAVPVVAAVLVSLRLSRPCAIWDREWHIPLVASLRGQSLPFMNIYNLNSGLFYHFAGDVQAAMLQTLSGGVLHSSLALSLSHDIMFGLLALALTLYLQLFGIRRWSLALLLFAGLVLIGPVTLLRDGTRKLDSGFAIVNYLTLSFRPHVALGYLLEFGFFALIAVGFLQPPVDRRRGDWLPHLLAITAALVVSDESSLGMLGLALGATWLLFPSVLGPRRRDGVVVLGALASVIVAASVLFVGSIGPGTPHYSVAAIAPRVPGYASASLSLATWAGRGVLLQDLLPVLGVLLGTALIALLSRDGAVIRALVFFGALLVPSVLALCCLEFEHKAVESHRFVTGLFMVAPLVAVFALSRLVATGGGASRLADGPALIIYVGLGLAAASTVEWLESGVAMRQCGSRGFYGYHANDFFTTNCRQETGARLWERTVPTYVESEAFYLYAGCHPLFASAPPLAANEHKVKVGRPWFGRPAVEASAKAVAPDKTLAVVCLAKTASAPADAVCANARALRGGQCEAAGVELISCPLSADERRSLLGKI